MPKSAKQKQKLLYIMKYLYEKTDENYGVTVSDIIDYLDANGISAERKSIYDDLRTLEDFGLDICSAKVGKTTLNFLGSREFEIAELKLLVDAVQSSKFITKSKSGRLIKKIEKLSSENEAKALHRQVIVADRVKTSNERVYYNIDAVNEAINSRRKISFFYTSWVLNRDGAKKITREKRKGGERYVVSPKALMWDDENYYLVAYDSDQDKIKHFRVDKMESIDILEDKADGSKEVDSLDPAAYSKQIFGMFGGKVTSVKLRFSDELIGVVVDRFSDKVFISPEKDKTFTVSVDVMISPQFFGWLFSLGDKAEIVSPKRVKDEFLGYAENVIEKYRG